MCVCLCCKCAWACVQDSSSVTPDPPPDPQTKENSRPPFQSPLNPRTPDPGPDPQNTHPSKLKREEPIAHQTKQAAVTVQSRPAPPNQEASKASRHKFPFPPAAGDGKGASENGGWPPGDGLPACRWVAVTMHDIHPSTQAHAPPPPPPPPPPQSVSQSVGRVLLDWGTGVA